MSDPLSADDIVRLVEMLQSASVSENATPEQTDVYKLVWQTLDYAMGGYHEDIEFVIEAARFDLGIHPRGL